jgi:hypothetical protein
LPDGIVSQKVCQFRKSLGWKSVMDFRRCWVITLPLWYILRPFGIWYIFPHFGLLDLEESGNPDPKPRFRRNLRSRIGMYLCLP